MHYTKITFNIFVHKQHLVNSLVLGLRQLFRWQTSSPAFEKSLSEDTDVAGMHKKCIALSDNWDLVIER